MATVLYIECDGCGRRFPKQWKNAGQTINFHIRGEIAFEGWQSVGNRQLDHCPLCVKAGKAPKKRPKKSDTLHGEQPREGGSDAGQ